MSDSCLNFAAGWYIGKELASLPCTSPGTCCILLILAGVYGNYIMSGHPGHKGRLDILNPDSPYYALKGADFAIQKGVYSILGPPPSSSSPSENKLESNYHPLRHTADSNNASERNLEKNAEHSEEYKKTKEEQPLRNIIDPDKKNSVQQNNSQLENIIDPYNKKSRVQSFLLNGIEYYQQNISPQIKEKLNRERLCKYNPSCSEYAKQAIEKYGALRGGILASGRLLRCNPWNKGGDDSVI